MKRSFASCVGLLIGLISILTWIASTRSSHIEDSALALLDEGAKLIKLNDPVSIQKAADKFKKAADIFHGMDNQAEDRNQGIAYYNMAIAYHKLKQDGKAIDAAQHALPLLHAKDARNDKANALANMGEYYIYTDEPEKAMDVYKQAELLYKELGQQEDVKHVLAVEGLLVYNQAAASAKKKDWPNALAASIKSQTLYHQGAYPAGEADAYHKIGLIYTVMKDSTKSAEAFQQEQTLRASTKPQPEK